MILIACDRGTILRRPKGAAFQIANTQTGEGSSEAKQPQSRKLAKPQSRKREKLQICQV
jgi:hypothetical protein